jgi:hypothetical protein
MGKENQGNQGGGEFIVVPKFTRQESQVIICHCIWNILADQHVQHLMSGSSEQLTFAFVGGMIGQPTSIGRFEIIVPKFDVIELLAHPKRTSDSVLVEQGFREAFSRFFAHAPSVTITN